MTDRRDRFEYARDPVRVAHVIVDHLATEAELLDFYASRLAFPDYFGRNWDAFNDCISDLSWLEASEVVVSHLGLPLLPANDVRIYLEILADAVGKTRNRPGPRLRVCFADHDRRTISRVLAEGAADANADFDEAMRLRDEGQHAGAIALLERIIAAPPPGEDRLIAMCHMQIAHMRELEDPVAVERHFRIATTLSPRSELASLGLFHALLHVSRTRDAMEEMLRLLRLRDSVSYRELLLGDFEATLPPDLHPLRDEVHRLLERPTLVEAPFDALIGLEAWGAKIGVGTFVTIEFGPPSEGTDGHGACHLWIQYCAWRLSWSADWIGSDDSKAAMQLAVAGLDGCTIRRATCSEYGDLRLEFSSGQVLETFAASKSIDDSPWTLFTPAGTYAGVPHRGERLRAEG